MDVKRVSILARAAGPSAGPSLFAAGAAKARGEKVLAMARQVKKDFMVEYMLIGVWQRGSLYINR